MRKLSRNAVLAVALWVSAVAGEASAQSLSAQDNRAGVEYAREIQAFVQSAVREHRLPAAIDQFSERLNEPRAQDPVTRHVLLGTLVVMLGWEAEVSGSRPRDVADQMVESYCTEMQRIARPDRPDLLADANGVCAKYWFMTQREGRALRLLAPLVSAEQPPTIRAGAALELSYSYESMGRTDEARASADLARESYEQIGGVVRDEIQPTLVYAELLRAAKTRNADVLRALWPRLDESLRKHRPEDVSVLPAAMVAYQGYSRIGATDLAQRSKSYIHALVEEQAAAEAKQVHASRAALDRLLREKRASLFPCIDLMLGNPVAAAADPLFEQRFADCEILLRNGRSDDLGAEFANVAAEVFEAKGDNARAALLYDQAISLAETVRAGYDVSARESFFGGGWRYAYDGALRVRAKLAATNGQDRGAFFSALAATERVRARQFGELRQADHAASVDELESFAQALPPESDVLTILVQENEVIAIVFSRDQQRVHIANIDRSNLEVRAQQTHQMLSDPQSDPAQIEHALQSLSRDILGDVQPFLNAAHRVTVLTDGALALIPAGLLSSDAAIYRPIGQSATIEYVPSLRLLMQAPPPEVPGNGIFALGDPVFPAIPPAPGVSPEESLRIGANRGATRREGNAITLNALPGTRTEVQSVALAFGSDATILLGENASESAVEHTDLRHVKFLHFATHGLLAGDFAGLAEPTLVLAAGGGEDGFLTASEIERLKINASLTVLSACNTGSGRIVAGEGVMALSRAFLIAGSRSVLAALWPIDDATTARFMQLFYGDLRAGIAPAVALDRARAAIRSSLSHPYFWAPFVLVKQYR